MCTELDSFQRDKEINFGCLERERDKFWIFRERREKTREEINFECNYLLKLVFREIKR
jgi:hypothetical protein